MQFASQATSLRCEATRAFFSQHKVRAVQAFFKARKILRGEVWSHTGGFCFKNFIEIDCPRRPASRTGIFFFLKFKKLSGVSHPHEQNARASRGKGMKYFWNSNIFTSIIFIGRFNPRNFYHLQPPVLLRFTKSRQILWMESFCICGILSNANTMESIHTKSV